MSNLNYDVIGEAGGMVKLHYNMFKGLLRTEIDPKALEHDVSFLEQLITEAMADAINKSGALLQKYSTNSLYDDDLYSEFDDGFSGKKLD